MAALSVVRAPLPGGFAETLVPTQAGHPSEWAMVQHPDGTQFAASHAWLNAVFCRPLAPTEWEQLTLAARYLTRRGETLVVVPPEEVAHYAGRLAATDLDKPVPWFVPR